jgi:hypothetical protein
VPLLYALEQLAQRWGVAPWLLETDDPLISQWIHRGLLFASFEAQARPKRKE